MNVFLANHIICTHHSVQVEFVLDLRVSGNHRECANQSDCP